MSLEQGSIVEGVVTGITNFGAFVELPGGQTGLVHISEVAEVYVKDINEFLKVNDKVKVKIIAVDPKGKIGLSLKQANPSSAPAPRAPRKPKFQPSFEDKLARFMKDSDERLSDLKRQTDSKRGGRGGSKF
ncbi:S1 RNA-binding domain-containing protein [Desulforamulus aquiferis]|uniref:S1 RNA-binding domain-containing protein n=1 Tax=Desulforamulus aquiferis TaxID=1397668 RepID=A0AAW7ZF89_9FIRM|nr:S1 RNA-binding domain-containing protein [Desulforamulus aquiferis]MDO7788037.1 S1 RNA-binding domain-containing protein [Desulforamulus aquiferis]